MQVKAGWSEVVTGLWNLEHCFANLRPHLLDMCSQPPLGIQHQPVDMESVSHAYISDHHSYLKSLH